jgi:hypothetical protein
VAFVRAAAWGLTFDFSNPCRRYSDRGSSHLLLSVIRSLHKIPVLACSPTVSLASFFGLLCAHSLLHRVLPHCGPSRDSAVRAILVRCRLINFRNCSKSSSRHCKFLTKLSTSGKNLWSSARYYFADFPSIGYPQLAFRVPAGCRTGHLRSTYSSIVRSNRTNSLQLFLSSITFPSKNTTFVAACNHGRQSVYPIVCGW